LFRFARNDVDIAAQRKPVIPRAGGVSSTPRPFGSITTVSGILDRPPTYCGKNPTMSIVNAAEAVLGK
jgi:hypothetical protein